LAAFAAICGNRFVFFVVNAHNVIRDSKISSHLITETKYAEYRPILSVPYYRLGLSQHLG